MKPVSRCKQIASALAAVTAMLSLLPDPAHAVGTLTGTVIESQATMTYKDANNNSYTASSNTVSATVSPVYSVSLSCAGDKSANSSTTAYYACTVTNTGNASNTITLAASSPPGWTTALYRDDGAGVDGTPNDGIHTDGEVTVTGSTGALAADSTYKFFVAVTVPASTANAATALTTLTVTGTGEAGAVDDASDTMTTTAQAPALTIEKDLRNLTTPGSFGGSVTAKPQETIEYRLKVTNGGSVTATEVVLQELLDTNLEYVPNSMRAGSTGSYDDGTLVTDAATGDTICATNICANGYFSDVWQRANFFIGLNASEAAGGSLAPTNTVYLFFRVKVK